TTTAKFKTSHPGEFAFLSKLSIPNRVMNAVLAWGEKNKAGGAQMAGYFLRTYRQLWQVWVPEDVAEKLDASL
ncbi:MAG: glycine/betaine ABC transporter substrate-binding protein, partial [Hyphomicrobiaceae bacterium]